MNKAALLVLAFLLITAGCKQMEVVTNPPTPATTPSLQSTPPEAQPEGAPGTIFGRDFSAAVSASEVTGGYVAKPKQEGNYPGVIMIHEWWGLNDNIKEMARVLANEGYVVFAVDLYNGTIATTADEARTQVMAVRENSGPAVAQMRAAVNYLRNTEGVTRVGSLGWCFGGGQSLQLSLAEPLDATVIYYGQLTDNQTQLRAVGGPVLGIFGENDTSIPVSSVEAFSDALTALNVSNKLHVYPGVGHAFANPSGNGFAPAETEDAWKKTVEFLSNNLKEPREIQIQAENFNFTNGAEMNPVIRVKQGEVIRVMLNNTQGFHDFVIDELGARTPKIRGPNSTSTTFVASKPGNFTYYCSVGMHRTMGMQGTIVVES